MTNANVAMSQGAHISLRGACKLSPDSRTNFAVIVPRKIRGFSLVYRTPNAAVAERVGIRHLVDQFHVRCVDAHIRELVFCTTRLNGHRTVGSLQSTMEHHIINRASFCSS